MADGVKWIKLSTSIFDNRKIKVIESMPDGDSIIVIWLKLLILASNVNDDGLVYLTKDVPYTDEMLASIFDKPIMTVRLALDTFSRFGMIEIVNDIIMISNWGKYQNPEGMEKIREQTRKRVSEYRERKKALLEGSNVTCNATETQCNALDIDIEKDKEDISIVHPSTDRPRAVDGDWEQKFDTFWSEYPKKSDKKKAKAKFKSIKPDDALFQRMMDGLAKWKRSEQWSDIRYVPFPTTWLNGERWEDEIPKSKEAVQEDHDLRGYDWA